MRSGLGAAEFDGIARMRYSLAKVFNNRSKEVSNFDALEVINLRPGFQTLEIKQTFDQPAKALRFARKNTVGTAAQLIGLKPIRRKHLRNLAERRQRSSKLMRDCCNEIRLQLRGPGFPTDRADD